MKNKREYEYDIVLSFAGEDRQYVNEVAEYLSAKGIKVFYDDYEQVDLWGKDLYEHLDKVYRNKGRFCVMFLSKYYADKLWTNHERKSAQARAFQEQREYILPARFDDTEVAGIRPTVGYIDLRVTSPEELGNRILAKLKKDASGNAPDKTFRKPYLKKTTTFNPYEEAQKFTEVVLSGIKKRCTSLSKELSASVFDRNGHKCLRIVYDGKTKYSLDMWIGGISGDSGISFYGVQGEMSSMSSGSTNAWADIVYSRKHNRPIVELHDMSLLETFSTKDKEYTYEEFFETLWECICKAIESE